MRKTNKETIEARVAEYQIPLENIIQFNFYAFPIAVAGAAVWSNETLARAAFDQFADSARAVLWHALRNGRIAAHRFEGSGDCYYTDYSYVFTVDTATYMLRMALHEWGKAKKSLPNTEIGEYAPKDVYNCQCIIVDNGDAADINTDEPFVEIASACTVTVLPLAAAQELLQDILENGMIFRFPVYRGCTRRRTRKMPLRGRRRRSRRTEKDSVLRYKIKGWNIILPTNI